MKQITSSGHSPHVPLEAQSVSRKASLGLHTWAAQPCPSHLPSEVLALTPAGSGSRTGTPRWIQDLQPEDKTFLVFPSNSVAGDPITASVFMSGGSVFQLSYLLLDF